MSIFYGKGTELADTRVDVAVSCFMTCLSNTGRVTPAVPHILTSKSILFYCIIFMFVLKQNVLKLLNFKGIPREYPKQRKML